MITPQWSVPGGYLYLCVCWGECVFLHSHREKRREEGEGRKGRVVWAKEGDGSMNNLCQVQVAETPLKLVSTVKEKNKVCVVLYCGRLRQPKTMFRDAFISVSGLWALPPPAVPRPATALSWQRRKREGWLGSKSAPKWVGVAQCSRLCQVPPSAIICATGYLKLIEVHVTTLKSEWNLKKHFLNYGNDQ